MVIGELIVTLNFAVAVCPVVNVPIVNPATNGDVPKTSDDGEPLRVVEFETYVVFVGIESNNFVPTAETKEVFVIVIV